MHKKILFLCMFAIHINLQSSENGLTKEDNLFDLLGREYPYINIHTLFIFLALYHREYILIKEEEINQFYELLAKNKKIIPSEHMLPVHFIYNSDKTMSALKKLNQIFFKNHLPLCFAAKGPKWPLQETTKLYFLLASYLHRSTTELTNISEENLAILNTPSIQEYLNKKYQNNRRFQTCLQFLQKHKDFCCLQSTEDLLTHKQEATTIFKDCRKLLHEIQKQHKMFSQILDTLNAMFIYEKETRENIETEEAILQRSYHSCFNWLCSVEAPRIDPHDHWKLID